MGIDISHNFDEVLPQIDDFFRREVPFAFREGIVGTAFRVRQHIVEKTYRDAFTVRNSRFAAINWRVDTTQAGASSLRAFKTYGHSMRVRVGQQPLKSKNGGKSIREYLGVQATGGMKRASDGGSVAIPADPNQRRLKGGAIPKAQKPTAIRNKKHGFVIGKGNKRRVVIRRKKKGPLETKFVLKNTVGISKRFMFHEDARRVAMENIDIEVALAMARTASKRRGRHVYLR